jgi:hypothetical protein
VCLPPGGVFRYYLGLRTVLMMGVIAVCLPPGGVFRNYLGLSTVLMMGVLQCACHLVVYFLTT